MTPKTLSFSVDEKGQAGIVDMNIPELERQLQAVQERLQQVLKTLKSGSGSAKEAMQALDDVAAAQRALAAAKEEEYAVPYNIGFPRPQCLGLFFSRMSGKRLTTAKLSPTTVAMDRVDRGDGKNRDLWTRSNVTIDHDLVAAHDVRLVSR